MHDSFDPFEYAAYVRRQWRVITLSCATAVLLSLVVSLLLPKRYTATASILIEPPGTNDARTATAVSPVYLESLRTYEHLAGSDTLFAQAVRKFHVQQHSQPLESLKRRVLKISKPRDTKILEISATLREPKLAQNFVQYLAEQTVSMNERENLAGDQELVEEAQKQMENARTRLERARAAWAETAKHEPVEALRNEIDADTDLRTKFDQDLAEAQAMAAEYQARQGQAADAFDSQQLAAARARVGVLEKRTRDLERSIGEKSAIVSQRVARRDESQSELKMAQAEYESAFNRLQDRRSGVGMRGERLRIIDPGIVPERPSSPNIPLNVIAAFLLALVASVGYVSFGFVQRRRTIAFRPTASRGLRA